MAEDVPKYAEWLRDEALLFETGTDPMTKEEIEDMRQKWDSDLDKFNFIMCLPAEKGGIPIGDLGLFFSSNDGVVDYSSGEISIMVADHRFRGCGYGREAYEMMVKWAHETLKTEEIVAKVKGENLKALDFFTRLGFDEIGRFPQFGEIHLRRSACI